MNCNNVMRRKTTLNKLIISCLRKFSLIKNNCGILSLMAIAWVRIYALRVRESATMHNPHHECLTSSVPRKLISSAHSSRRLQSAPAAGDAVVIQVLVKLAIETINGSCWLWHCHTLNLIVTHFSHRPRCGRTKCYCAPWLQCGAVPVAQFKTACEEKLVSDFKMK